ncbi:PucR family transcriptional regulator [Mycobacterium sp. ITM-2016-00317]|uniref:PucR family transcriptional regulator n=1 Tax=Mycobacterium sp. ITM-2016-00317 TaxID=2099694 RepID=UPI00287F4743|nr:PucR family transcriptional regulator [Mycobacterium sp. ITM-2016-00317]WNG87524.1 PucR family transcriptional regulator [Mycobacterium sp. ITM-2016-00317]
MLRVADLVSDASLELDVLSGRDGLSRAVTWTHVAEIPDAAQWLEGGELLLTVGLGIPTEPEAQVAYLEALAKVKASCLGIGHRAPPLSDDLLKAGDDLALPIVRVGVQVPFARISRIVAAGNLDLSQSRLALQIRILESLRWWSEADVDTRSVFDRLESVTGFDIYVVDKAGRPALPGMRPAPAGIRNEIPGLRRYPIITDGFGAVVPISGPEDSFVVLQHRSDDGATGVVVARQVATVAAVHLSDHYRRQEEDLRRGSELLNGLLSGDRPRAGTLDYLRGRGFDLDAPVRLYAVRSRGAGMLDSTLLHNKWFGTGSPALISAGADYILILCDTPLTEAAGLLAALDVVAGASDSFRFGADLKRYRQQAVWAMQNISDATDSLVEYQGARQFTPWFSMGAETMGAVIEQVLGPLLRHDEAKGSELVRTLETYLRRERSVAKAAEELVIHPHTLRYRLAKIEELTSRSLSATQDVAEFWWALRARGVPT